MANNNALWKVLGIAGMVIGLIGGTIGIMNGLGPAKDLARLEQDQKFHETRIRANELAIAVIDTKLNTLLQDMQTIKEAVK
jgi:hypothetical protein